MTHPIEPIIKRSELPARLGRHTDTIRRMIKSGKFPPPDVDLSRKTRGWNPSTLRAWGVNL